MLRGLIKPAVVLTIALCVITGAVYPALITSAAQLLFAPQANGSLVRVHGVVVGSALIGQTFIRDEYFHSRPSAAGTGYDGTASGGTNKGPTDRRLADTLVAQRADSAVATLGATPGHIPADLVTASGSGLDPHISPANAQLQLPRVIRARRADSASMQRLLDAHIEGRQFGIFGEPRVNVLLLNVAIDSAFPLSRSVTSTPLN